MYTNDDNGNGSKRTKLTMADLKSGAGGIATADEGYPELLDGREGEHEAGRSASAERTSLSAERKNARQDASTSTRETTDTDRSPEDEEETGVELLEKDERRTTLKRVVVALGVAACALCVVAVGGYLWLFSAGRDDTYRVRHPASRNHADVGASNDDNSPQIPTAEEIARELKKGGNSNSASKTNQEMMAGAAANNNSDLVSNSPVTDRLPLADFSATITPQTNTGTLPSSQSTVTQNATGQTSEVDSTQGATTNREMTVTKASSELGSPNPERSIRVSALLANNGGNNARAAGSENLPGSTTPTTSAERTTQPVPLPPLGTMLPIRTLGAVYTLRSEGYVRTELTRDMSGQGWSLPRGTELYGVVRGSDFEIGRAYIHLVGFIDRRSGKLVRLEGSLLGTDGREGLRGQKQNLNSGWSRALKTIGAGLLEALSTVAAGLGSRPVYAGDVYGHSAPRIASPLMREINGLAYREGRAGFVEVPANTAGYVFVMTHPKEIQGVDVGDMSTPVDELRRMSDTGQARRQGQLSEAELVELMTKGNTDEIRRALPRMTPEMRRVAQAVLGGL